MFVSFTSALSIFFIFITKNCILPLLASLIYTLLCISSNWLSGEGDFPLYYIRTGVLTADQLFQLYLPMLLIGIVLTVLGSVLNLKINKYT